MIPIPNEKNVPYNQNAIMVEPVGFCNLKCKYCYTKQGNRMLDVLDIISFVDKFLKSAADDHVEIFLVGAGEVTLYPHLSQLVNLLSGNHPSVSFYIQTNGIDNRFIDKIIRKDNIIIGVSLDGFKKDNDSNRGPGTYEKILASIKKFTRLDMKVNVHSIVTPENLGKTREFQSFIKSIDHRISVTFAPLYLDHPSPDIVEMKRLLDTTYLDIKGRFGYDVDDRPDNKRYISIGSDGLIYDCCELVNKIGDINTSEPSELSKFIRDNEQCSTCPSRSCCFPKIFT